MPSSRPPPSMYPPIPKGVTPLPPFPQLLHIKDDPSTQSYSQTTPNVSDSRDSVPQLSDNEEDELEDNGTAASPGPSSKDKKERKPHATRRRVVQSCSECRRRKIKCDKKFPCGPCILRSDQARCHEVGMVNHTRSRRTNFATTSELAALAHRLDALEASLLKNGALRSTDLDHFIKVLRDGEGPSTTVSRKSTKASSAPQALAEEETVDDTEGAALTLEHLAFGRSRADGSHAMPHFGTRLSSVSRPAPNNDYHLARSIVPQHAGLSPSTALAPVDGMLAFGPRRHSSYNLNDGASGGSGAGSGLSQEERAAKIDQLLELIGPTDIFELFYRKTDVAIVALTRLLPSRQRGELLVRTYLEKVDWLHRCMHVPTFLRQCNDLWCLPPDRVAHEIALPFIGLYFTVCTLGLQFMEQSEISKNFTVEEAHTLPDTWFNAARSALWAADFVGSHTMEALQCIILLGVFMNNRDRADAAWALLGAAIKMAQGLGLSRLGAEQQVVDGKPLPMWTGRWESLIQREVGRRIWWNLVFLDWSLAPSYNFSCSIQPDQIKTALPSNIEDEDIIDGQPFRPQPLQVRTGMSFQLARLKFAEISQRQIWQANNNHHPPYSFILSVDGELRKAMMELPTFFQPDSNTKGPPSKDPKALVQYYEKIMLNLAIHSRMMRLHRPWLSRGYEDERFAYSKEQCIRAARASLRMMSDADGTASFLEKWWLPLFYVSVSGLVVIIDLLRTPRRHMYSSETDEKIAEVKGALDQMRGIMDVSHPARAAVRVMDLLLAEVEERRKTPGSTLGKRKSSLTDLDDDESGGLQRAVKKLIHQAQLEAESPNTSMASASTPQGETRAPSQSPQQQRERVETDRTHERPVFDAYPMPFNPVPPTISNATTSSLAPPPQNIQPGGSPFTFPVDPTNATSFPTFDGRSFGQQTLDPAVQSMLSSYFPQPAGNGNMAGPAGSAAVPQVPDDFLSRVFGFGWDATGNAHAPGQGQGQGGLPSNGGQDQGQGPQHHQQMQGQQGQGQQGDIQIHPPQHQMNGGQQQQNTPGGQQPNPAAGQPGQGQGPPQQGIGMPGGPDFAAQNGFGGYGWSSHGWMA
ncbi:nuclear protein [Kwoniella heveanensis CBS 569]|uniref:Nuclear protein n=1 Tax=Kwoniella heveanensis BCC8398 TaxID=1296120 RepID=A0A1B9GRS6_9TREE|nr:nuclear protein [Kwoniella heveanensis BCC8398]OCF39270.1 nuclear protein [Kwoniella heveanensis CBS 569]